MYRSTFDTLLLKLYFSSISFKKNMFRFGSYQCSINLIFATDNLCPDPDHFIGHTVGPNLHTPFSVVVHVCLMFNYLFLVYIYLHLCGLSCSVALEGKTLITLLMKTVRRG